MLMFVSFRGGLPPARSLIVSFNDGLLPVQTDQLGDAKLLAFLKENGPIKIDKTPRVSLRLHPTNLKRVDIKRRVNFPVKLRFVRRRIQKDVRAKINGDVIAMEMVPKDFKLNPN